MQVPPLDLVTQYDALRPEMLEAVSDVLDTQLCCNGPAVRNFEQQVQDYTGCARALGVSSGTDALLMCLMGLEIGTARPQGPLTEGLDEVITTPFSFFGTAGVIWRLGAKPVFVDIRPESFNIDPERIEAAITERTRAILPVHLYGQMAEMDRITTVAEKHGVPVIEDAAQAIGAEYRGKGPGHFGAAACLSFYPTKNIGAVGDAGMVVTGDGRFADKLEKLRNHGQSQQYFHDWVGGNFRMDSIQAAALAVKLRRLDEWNDRRRQIAGMYDELLGDCDGVVLPERLPHRRHVFHQYVIRAEKRDQLRSFLKDHGVFSGVYYPLSLHLQPCFAALGHKEGDFPESERATREVLALPIFAEMTDVQVHTAAEAIRGFYARG